MWLSPLKGAHLTLGQLDKTLPVDLDFIPTGGTKKINEGIQRGSIVFITTGKSATAAPRFQLYTSAEAAKPNAVPYIALMSVKDFQAGMAGSVGQAPEVDDDFVDKGTPGDANSDAWLGKADVVGVGKTDVYGVSTVRGPRITAISLVQPAEWQTTAYDHSQAAVAKYYVGAPLTVNDDGLLTPWEDGNNIVGYVTAVPKVRWINDLGASADGARISGGNAKVIEFSTAWIPVAAVATGDDKNVDMLSLKGAKVDAKAGAPAPAADAPAAGAKAGAPAPAAGAKGDTKPQGK